MNKKKKSGNEEEGEKPQGKEKLEKFIFELVSGIAVKKFPSSDGYRISYKAQPRTIWLDQGRNVLYWQKGKKNKSTVKLESSLRMKDVIGVSVGIKSDVLRKAGTSKNSDLYLTLQSSSGGRNLDLECPDRELRNRLADGFRLMLSTR